MKIGWLTVCHGAGQETRPDRDGPEIERLLRSYFPSASFVSAAVSCDMKAIASSLREMADKEECSLVVTTGGVGVGMRDITPEATLAVLERELPGFMEVLRVQVFSRLPSVVLFRGIAGTRGRTLIVNLPGNQEELAECLGILIEAIREGISSLAEHNPQALSQPGTSR